MGVGLSEASHYLLATISLHVWNRYVPNTKHTHTHPYIDDWLTASSQGGQIGHATPHIGVVLWMSTRQSWASCKHKRPHMFILHRDSLKVPTQLSLFAPKRFNTRKNVLVNTKYLSMGLYLPLSSANMQ